MHVKIRIQGNFKCKRTSIPDFSNPGALTEKMTKSFHCRVADHASVSVGTVSFEKIIKGREGIGKDLPYEKPNFPWHFEFP